MATSDLVGAEREIGKIVSVSNYQVTVLLGQDVRGQVRAYPQHISFVTQIGGYLLFPVAPGESAVGIVIGAFEHEIIEHDDDKSLSLQFGAAQRRLRINLLGQLRDDEPFKPGISVYPALDSPALLPTEKELRSILEYQPHKEDAERNCAASLGVSPIYARQKVTVSYNDLLARPMGIMGNTGSGKSYSVASVIQEALSAGNGSAKLARFIILDINGEYATAFGSGAEGAGNQRELNRAYLNGKPFWLPLWAFNLHEINSFFEASQASQTPVLERVITSIREDALDSTPGKEIRKIVRLVDGVSSNFDSVQGLCGTPTGPYSGQKTKFLVGHINSGIAELRGITNADIPTLQRLAALADADLTGMTDHNIPPAVVQKIQAFLDSTNALLEEIRQIAITRPGYREVTADSPVPFDSKKLLQDMFFLSAISRFRGQERIQEYLATLRLRIHRQMADKRWAVFTQHPEILFESLLKAVTGDEAERVVIIDCSMLAHDVLPLFCAVFGRLLLELRAHASPSNRTDQPFVLVLEEAHNYLKPRREDESFGTRLARDAFERIAKEGRKFGLSLMVASQRPSDVSATVISQCANFLVHRIQNPEDIDYFKKILPSGSRDLLDQLPILAPGDGIVLGSACNVPARVRVKRPKPAPSSETPRPWDAWKDGRHRFKVADAVAIWAKEMNAEAEENQPADPLAEPPPEE